MEFWSEIEQLARPPDLCLLDFVLRRAGLPDVSRATTSASDLVWLKKRFGERTRVLALTADAAHPELATIGDTPVFDKPLDDEKIEAIEVMLRRTPGIRPS